MTLSMEIDQDSRSVLAVYMRLRTGAVARTVEIEEDVCFADEDAGGNLLGVEMLAPGNVTLLSRKVAARYHAREIDEVLERAKAAFA